MEQNFRRRDSDIGRIRTATQDAASRYIPEESGLVQKMDV